MYGLILGHVLWKDFAQLGDQKTLEFLTVTVDKIKNQRKMETHPHKHVATCPTDSQSSMCK